MTRGPFSNKGKEPLKAYFRPGVVEAGCDEAGRGCLAGPVFAAAVILPNDFFHPTLDDSKKLSHKQRMQLRQDIESRSLAWAVAQVDHEEIDRINILNASIRAMQLAVDQLDIRPEFLLIDGHRFLPYADIEHRCVIRGDGEFAAIAAASILAKTYRDDYMCKLDEIYPAYGWKENKGYGTKFHKAQLEVFGTSPYHRQTFRW